MEQEKKDCCRKEENLDEIYRNFDTVVYECRECHCKHWEVTVDVAVLNSQVM